MPASTTPGGLGQLVEACESLVHCGGCCIWHFANALIALFLGATWEWSAGAGLASNGKIASSLGQIPG